MSTGTEPAVRAKPRVRLAFARMLFRLALVLSLLVELALWVEAGKQANPPALPRWVIFLFYSPRFLFVAFLVASGITILADLVVQLIIRPAVLRWHSPRSNDEVASFHMSAFEAVIGSSSARRKVGRRWGAGMLIRTNSRLWFFPNSSDHEPFCLPAGKWSDVKTIAAPRMFLGMVRDLPEYVQLTTKDHAFETFALAVPRDAVIWLDASPASAIEQADARRAS